MYSNYECKKCNGMMKHHKETSKGTMYKCDNCGHTGYMEGMTESKKNSAGIDPSDFGL